MLTMFSHQTKEACAVYVTSYLKVLGKPVKQNGITAHALGVKPLSNPLFYCALENFLGSQVQGSITLQLVNMSVDSHWPERTCG